MVKDGDGRAEWSCRRVKVIMILSPTIKSVCGRYEGDRGNVQENPCKFLSNTERITMTEAMAAADKPSEPSVKCVREGLGMSTSDSLFSAIFRRTDILRQI